MNDPFRILKEHPLGVFASSVAAVISFSNKMGAEVGAQLLWAIGGPSPAAQSQDTKALVRLLGAALVAMGVFLLSCRIVPAFRRLPAASPSAVSLSRAPGGGPSAIRRVPLIRRLLQIRRSPGPVRPGAEHSPAPSGRSTPRRK